LHGKTHSSKTGLSGHPPTLRFWGGPGFSRAVTIPDEPPALAQEVPANATGKTSAVEIESQRTARRREQAGVFPTVRVRPAEVPRSLQLKARYTATLWQRLRKRETLWRTRSA
jgi:hypothetical protein